MTNVVVFDLDDTLYPEKDYALSGFKAVSDWLTSTRDVSGFFEYCQGFFNEGKRGNIFNLVLDQLGVTYNATDIKELVQIYRQHKPRIKLFEDATWAIDFFQKEKLAIITDGYYETQVNKIASLNINNKFATIVYTDEFGREFWKPSPFSYQKIMNFFQCNGSCCHYVADNPTKDFITAKKFGWHTIQVSRQEGEYSNISVDKYHQADELIHSLYELKKLF